MRKSICKLDESNLHRIRRDQNLIIGRNFFWSSKNFNRLKIKKNQILEQTRKELNDIAKSFYFYVGEASGSEAKIDLLIEKFMFLERIVLLF